MTGNTSKEHDKRGARNRKSTSELTLTNIKDLLEILKENDVSEFSLEREKEKLTLKRGPQEKVSVIAAPGVPASQYCGVNFPYPQEEAVQHSLPSAKGAEIVSGDCSSKEALPEVVEENASIEICSPMVGTFYARPAPDAPPFVKVGDIISKGQVLCIVEAMKIMNEIEADKSGKLVEVCLEDGQMVEYGEVVFRLAPL